MHTAEEAALASHHQIASPQPADHHVPAHKHQKPHHAGGKKTKEEDEENDENTTGGEDEEEVDEEGAEGDESETGSGSGEEEGSEGSSDEKFPYERDLFSLCPSYHFIKRLYTCDDAVTYKAFSKLTNQVVAIKICDGYDGKVTPKEVRLLNRAQGHPNICVMNGWHPFPQNHSYAIITQFIENEPIETIFDSPQLHKVFMKDMLSGLQHMHARGILFRDLKPSNCLWSSAEKKAIIIDFDVGSYYDPVNLHRSMVGTDGYMVS